MALPIRNHLAVNKKPLKLERVEARVTGEQKKLFQHAADLLGRPFSDFIVNTLQKAAQRIIKQHEILHLALEDRKTFIRALMTPPKPNQHLQRAKQRHEKELGNQ